MQLRASSLADNSTAQADVAGCDVLPDQSHIADNPATIPNRRPAILRIFAGKLFDSEARVLLSNRIISVSASSGLILSVAEFDASEAVNLDDGSIDLRNATVLPGFVDAHVHFFLHPYSETSWDEQVTKESLAERTVRATVHAKRTLLAGFTTVRDLGTEGAGDADMALRKCLSGTNPIIPGPRYFCASRALVSTGSYGPKSTLFPNKEGVNGVTGAEVVDGVTECVKAVRRQVGAGADWIKVYADYRIRSRMVDVAPGSARAAIPTFKYDELWAIIDTASSLGVKVAAHASDWTRIASLPFDSVEHGNESIPPGAKHDTHNELASAWDASKLGGGRTVWVPTLAAYYTIGGSKWLSAWRTFRAAIAAGFDNIACGGDTGVFAHGDNALEMRLMVAAGASWQKVLAWATYGGWKCVRPATWEGSSGETRLRDVDMLNEDPRVVGDNEVPFGVIRRGFAADIVATTGDVERDLPNAVTKEKISFVMKGGRVYKKDGKEVV